jgi:hypothetical protein
MQQVAADVQFSQAIAKAGRVRDNGTALRSPLGHYFPTSEEAICDWPVELAEYFASSG